MSTEEAANLTRHHLWRERALVDSFERFFRIPGAVRAEADAFLATLEKVTGLVQAENSPRGDGQLVFRRSSRVKGPMSAFGYDYFTDHYGEERASKLRLLEHQGLRGSGSEYAYEVLNLVDGRRTAQQIRDAVAATYGPVPLDLVVEYLRALGSIRVIEAAR